MTDHAPLLFMPGTLGRNSQQKLALQAPTSSHMAAQWCLKVFSKR